MGTRGRTNPAVLGAAVAGAVLSTVATILQMCAVLAATSMTVLRELSIPLVCAGLAAASYGAFFTIKALRGTKGLDSQAGHAFSFSSAIILAATLSGILVVSAALRENFGEIGMHCRRRIGRLCGYAFGSRLDRFAGRLREDESGRRRFSDPCRVVDQHDQQDHRRMDQWGTILRVAADSGAAPGHSGGMGRNLWSASVRTVSGEGCGAGRKLAAAAGVLVMPVRCRPSGTSSSRAGSTREFPVSSRRRSIHPTGCDRRRRPPAGRLLHPWQTGTDGSRRTCHDE